jgi:hypothetical protein
MVCACKRILTDHRALPSSNRKRSRLTILQGAGRMREMTKSLHESGNELVLLSTDLASSNALTNLKARCLKDMMKCASIAACGYLDGTAPPGGDR